MADLQEVARRTLKALFHNLVMFAVGKLRECDCKICPGDAPVDGIQAINQRREGIDQTDCVRPAQVPERAQCKSRYQVYEIGFQFDSSPADDILLQSPERQANDNATALISRAHFRRWPWFLPMRDYAFGDHHFQWQQLPNGGRIGRHRIALAQGSSTTPDSREGGPVCIQPKRITCRLRRQTALSRGRSRGDSRRCTAKMVPSRSREPEFNPPYGDILRGVLSFKTLAETEATLIRLEILRQRFLASSDKKGVEYCRLLGTRGKHRAELIARNQRVAPQKRLQKQEASLWFRIWLETPELFAEWLSLRKRTEGFKRLQGLEINS
jgi:hypothetical protein